MYNDKKDEIQEVVCLVMLMVILYGANDPNVADEVAGILIVSMVIIAAYLKTTDTQGNEGNNAGACKSVCNFCKSPAGSETNDKDKDETTRLERGSVDGISSSDR